MKKSEESIRKTINRRDFLYKLGTGTTVAIAGYFIADSFSNFEQNKNTKASDKPLLKEDVITYYENDDLHLSYKNVKYCVNKTGAEVLHLLDGNHSIYDISTKISNLYHIEQTEMLTSSIAIFISQLASAGFLFLPFYATLYENYE